MKCHFSSQQMKRLWTLNFRPFCVSSPLFVHNRHSSPCSRNLARHHGFPSPHSWTSHCSRPHRNIWTVTWFKNTWLMHVMMHCWTKWSQRTHSDMHWNSFFLNKDTKVDFWLIFYHIFLRTRPLCGQFGQQKWPQLPSTVYTGWKMLYWSVTENYCCYSQDNHINSKQRSTSKSRHWRKL